MIARSTAVSNGYWVWPGSSDGGWSSSKTRKVWSLASRGPAVSGGVELHAVAASRASATITVARRSVEPGVIASILCACHAW